MLEIKQENKAAQKWNAGHKAKQKAAENKAEQQCDARSKASIQEQRARHKCDVGKYGRARVMLEIW